MHQMENWEACARLLAGVTDEEKFAGLLLVTKYLRTTVINPQHNHGVTTFSDDNGSTEKGKGAMGNERPAQGSILAEKGSRNTGIKDIRKEEEEDGFFEVIEKVYRAVGLDFIVRSVKFAFSTHNHQDDSFLFHFATLVFCALDLTMCIQLWP